jgi:hypothetical protein
MQLKFLFALTFICFNLNAQTFKLPLDPGRFAGATSFVQANNGAFIYSSIVLPPSIFGPGGSSNLTSFSANL